MSISAKYRSIIVLPLFAALLGIGFAQQPDVTTLKALTYDSLIDLFDQNSLDSAYARHIARVYIQKAREDGDSTKIARGYQRIAFVSPLSEAVKYLDTTIALSGKSEHPNFPASGYLFKAHYHYELEQYERSLQNAIEGYRYSKEKGNVEQQLVALHQINGVNELWGDYETALETGYLTRDLVFENPELPDFTRNYLSSLETIGKCYVQLNKPDSALVYFNRGIEVSLKDQDSISYYAFVSQSGTALYTLGAYRRALDSLFKADVIREYYNNSYLPGFYYHVGASLYNLDRQEEGMRYFHKIDSIYESRSVLYPVLPKVYDKMIEYYQQNDNREKQLEFLRKQVLALKLIDDKRIFIKEKTNQDYVIPTMVAAKEEQIAKLEQRNKASTYLLWSSLGLLVISLGSLAYYIQRQRLFRKRFEKLIQQQNGNEESTSNNGLDELGISVEIVEDILAGIANFEKDEGFLDNALTLNGLAKKLRTNSTYLSKVINVKKNKNFSSYINDLRVDHSVKKLQQNPTFRKFTIKAIADECGFKSAESFSKSFYRCHGIYPSYFIKQLENA